MPTYIRNGYELLASNDSPAPIPYLQAFCTIPVKFAYTSFTAYNRLWA